MNEWLVAAVAMLALLAPCGYVAQRGSPVERLLGLQVGATVTTMTLLLLAEGFGRSIYVDLALVYCVLSFTGTLTIVRFLERWV